MLLTAGEEEFLHKVPDCLWSTSPSDVGLIKGALPVQIRPKTEYRPCVRQYPLKSDAREGIKPVISDLIKAGVIVECNDSPCNTPIFPVKKAPPSVGWRLVLDLQAVNSAVIQRAPCVPDPHTLLNSLDPEAMVFTVVDVSNAFFSIPVDIGSQFWFAFTFESKKYTFTRLPQGYCESPTIYSQMMTASMSKFIPPGGSQILVYVDDVLVASPNLDTCKTDTIALLNHLAQEGHKVSKNKLQLCKEQVKYLGHSLSKSGRTILESRKATVLQAPKPLTKKQMMSFLGLTNYCRGWIPNYAEIIAPLSKLMYEKNLKMTSLLHWTTEAENAFCEIKQMLTSSLVLALPDYSRPFIQMVDCRDVYMTSVLSQKHGDKLRPIAYFSSRLDNVACALPHCVRAVIAASMAVICSSHIVLFHTLILKVPHAVAALLLQTNMTFLSPARHLSCMAILLSQPHLTLERCTTLNPATLMPLPEDGDRHDCQELAEQTTKCRPDLDDQPRQTGEVIFVDGSSKKNNFGKTQTGYAVVTVDKILKAGPLPPHYSAQAAELVALTEACKMMTNKSVTVYTDSQYAFSTCHVFAQYWKNRGMIISTGKPVTHAELLSNLLNAVQLPQQIAICKCAAHSTGIDYITLGNAFADKAAKDAASRPFLAIADCKQQDNILQSDILFDMQQQSPTNEQKMWEKKGATLQDRIYVSTDKKPILPKNLFKWAAVLSHGSSHVSARAMVSLVEKHFTTYGFNLYSTTFCRACLICAQHNSQGNLRPRRGRFPKATYPFQRLHMDFIELNKSEGKRYCLVIIDAFSKWSKFSQQNTRML